MATTKYVLNSATDAVTDMLDGLAAANSQLSLYRDQKVVLQEPLPRDRVLLLSGGGSGHEPFAAGYVGEGMLSGAVAGNIFTSPPAGNIEDALEALCKDNNRGVLVIVANYTGDVLNFGIACERAKLKGHRVESVIVGEDIALADTGRISLAGKRGMCGIVFVIKVAGAMAASGRNLEEITSEVKNVSDSMSTLGVCLSPCSIPGSGPMFNLEENQIDLGLGIHGEAGICRKKLVSAEALVTELLDKIFGSLGLKAGSSICILVNNLATLTQLEMGIVQKEIYAYCKKKQVSIARLYSGPLMTSLDMKGFQICVLRMDRSEWVKWLDGATSAPGWPWALRPEPVLREETRRPLIGPMKSLEEVWKQLETKGSRISLKPEEKTLVMNCLEAAASSLKLKKDELNVLDQTCGDGDCGSTLYTLAQGVSQLSASQSSLTSSPLAILNFLEHWAQSQMGGTSGALYSLFFLAGAACVEEKAALDWPEVFAAGVKGLFKYSAARQGDRTMLDVLIACKETLERPDLIKDGRFVATHESLNLLRANVTKACEDTKHMIPRAGRASNVDASLVQGVDAGAYGAAIWITAIIDEVQKYIR